MIATSSDILSEKNFIPLDPNDTRRILTPAENLLVNYDYGVFSIYTISNKMDPKHLEKALDKFYEWYPVVGMSCTEPINGMRYYKDGIIRPTTFAQDLKNNEVIRSKTDYYNVLSNSYYDYYNEKRYEFGPRLYKVDLSQGESDPLLEGDIGYLMVAPSSHLVFDGKSSRVLGNFINGWMTDKNYKPRIANSQIMPNSISALVSKNEKLVPMPIPPIGEVDHIGYDERQHIDLRKRGITMDVRKIPKSDLRRPKGVSLTSAITGIHGFIYTSLLLDYNDTKPAVGQAVGCPYIVHSKKFIKVVEGNSDDLVGNDIGSTRTYFRTQRDAPLKLYQFIQMAKENHQEYLRDPVQKIINERFLSYDVKMGQYEKNSIFVRVSNFGDLKLKKGPITTSFAFGIFTMDIGCINLVLAGQADGGIIFFVCGHKTSFCQRVTKLYGDLFIKVSKLSEKRDVSRKELIEMPEYKELIEAIKK